jgi:hypothetical protein
MKRIPKIYALYLGLVITYSALTFFGTSEAAAERYNVSHLHYQLLNLSVTIPYMLIWLAGFYGYQKLAAYAGRIKKTKDGKHVNLLAKGIFMLVLWPPLSSILATSATALKLSYPGVEAAGVLINGYFNLLWPFIGFILIGTAARRLTDLAKLRPTARAVHMFGILVITLGVIYAQLVSYAYDESPGRFHMPYWVVVLTLVIPYIYMWFVGLWATHLLYLYQHKVPGVIYRRSWRLLSLSVGAIIIMQIIIQYLGTIVSKLAEMSINKYVLVIYVVLILLAVGYILLARGAKRLQKIEEV